MQYEDTQMLTVKQVAEILTISPGSVYRLKDAGEIPHYVFGRGTIRFMFKDVMAYLNSTYVNNPPAEPPQTNFRHRTPRPGQFPLLEKYGYRPWEKKSPPRKPRKK